MLWNSILSITQGIIDSREKLPSIETPEAAAEVFLNLLRPVPYIQELNAGNAESQADGYYDRELSIGCPPTGPVWAISNTQPSVPRLSKTPRVIALTFRECFDAFMLARTGWDVERHGRKHLSPPQSRPESLYCFRAI